GHAEPQTALLRPAGAGVEERAPVRRLSVPLQQFKKSWQVSARREIAAFTDGLGFEFKAEELPQFVQAKPKVRRSRAEHGREKFAAENLRLQLELLRADVG